MANAIRGMPAGIHTVDLAHSSLVIHRIRMPFGIPRRPALQSDYGVVWVKMCET